MDVGTCNRLQVASVVPSRELLARIAAVHPLEPVQSAYRGEVAERYRFVDGSGDRFRVVGESAFLWRLYPRRLSADGQLYTCLFGRHGHDLKSLLRGDADDAALRAAIAGVWGRRGDRYSEEGQAAAGARDGRVEMYRIGG